MDVTSKLGIDEGRWLAGASARAGPLGRKTMIRKFVLGAALLGAVASLPGCFSFNMEENDRMISHWGDNINGMRKLTNRYFFDFDADDPFDG